jgi:hypothetical protein
VLRIAGVYVPSRHTILPSRLRAGAKAKRKANTARIAPMGWLSADAKWNVSMNQLHSIPSSGLQLDSPNSLACQSGQHQSCGIIYKRPIHDLICACKCHSTEDVTIAMKQAAARVACQAQREPADRQKLPRFDSPYSYACQTSQHEICANVYNGPAESFVCACECHRPQAEPVCVSEPNAKTLDQPRSLPCTSDAATSQTPILSSLDGSSVLFVSLPQEQACYVGDLVQRGHFASADEVVQAALQALKKHLT